MTASGRADNPRRGLPLRWLLAALVVHLVLLAWPLPAPSVSSPPSAPPTLQTRQVVLPAPTPVAAAAPARVKPVAPARPALATPASAVAEPAPAPALAPPPEVAPAPVAIETTAPEPTAPTPTPAETTTVAEAPPPQVAPEPEQPVPPSLQWPPSGRLSYAVTAMRGGAAYEATGVLNWQADGDRYELRLVWRAFIFSREQSSTGRMAADGLHPERFAERTRSERAAHFDESAGRVRFSANTPDAPLRPGTQDRLSLFLQLAGRFNATPQAFAPGTQIRLPVAGTREVEEWTLTVEGRETLELPAGTTHTVKLQRLPRREFDQKVEIWLEPARGHLPVRIRLTDPNGDVADQQLSGQ